MRDGLSIRIALLLGLLLGGCAKHVQVGSDCEGDAPCESSTQASSNDVDAGEVPAEPVSIGDIDRLDLLVVVDDSGSMKEEQDALASALPKLLHALSTGRADGSEDGDPEFRPVSDIHLGVVSSDMGLVGIDGIERCSGLGDDGVLQSDSCSPEPFLSFDHPSLQELQDAVACRVQLGVDGCGFEQQLEAGLKALASGSDITFLADADGNGTRGHGQTENDGFLRDDSLLVVMVLSDEDDCSALNTRLFTPNVYLSQDDPLLQQGLNLRCFYNPDQLYPITRYVTALQALRPGTADRSMFFAIAGMPPETVDADALSGVSLESGAERADFYASILDHQLMQPVVDDQGTADPADDMLRPCCNSSMGLAYPGTRLIKVARGFGQNGLVQSICEQDLGPAMDAFLHSIARRLGPAPL